MKTKFQPQNARELALVALEGVVENGAYSNLQVDQLLKSTCWQIKIAGWQPISFMVFCSINLPSNIG